MSGSIGKNRMFNTHKKEDVQAIRSAHKPFTSSFLRFAYYHIFFGILCSYRLPAMYGQKAAFEKRIDFHGEILPKTAVFDNRPVPFRVNMPFLYF